MFSTPYSSPDTVRWSRSVLKSLHWPGHCALEDEVFLTPYASPDTVHWKQKCSQVATLARTLCLGAEVFSNTLCTGSRNVLNSLLWLGHCALEAEVFSSRYSGPDTVHWNHKPSQVPILARTLCIGSRSLLKSLLWTGHCALEA